jgi:DNA-binding CsgD family transcriptional regulator
VGVDSGHLAGLSQVAVRLYGQIAAGTQPDEYAREPELRELTAARLVACEGGRWVALEPRPVVARNTAEDLLELSDRLRELSQRPALADALTEVFQRSSVGGARSVFLPDAAAANACIQDVVANARGEILSAQPGGPRSRELMLTSIRRDSEALRRGVVLRTLYRDTVRDHEVTAEWAATMTAEGAEYRTVHSPFQRIIIVDREHAFISDYVKSPDPHSAWHVTDRAVVAVMARVYENLWHRAVPWSGEPRDTTVRPVVVAGLKTNALQREILRDLCAGRAQRSTAARLGMSVRTLSRHLDDLKVVFRVQTLNELIFRFAKSPDSEVDDARVDAVSRPGETTGQAVA